MKLYLSVLTALFVTKLAIAVSAPGHRNNKIIDNRKRNYNKNRTRLRRLRYQRRLNSVAKIYAISKNEAALYLRSERHNAGNEELMVGNLERECVEEICSLEEISEIFPSNVKKAHFLWKSYTQQCITNPCHRNNTDMCMQRWQGRTCVCKTGFYGERCGQSTKDKVGRAFTDPKEMLKRVGKHRWKYSNSRRVPIFVP